MVGWNSLRGFPLRSNSHSQDSYSCLCLAQLCSFYLYKFSIQVSANCVSTSVFQIRFLVLLFMAAEKNSPGIRPGEITICKKYITIL